MAFEGMDPSVVTAIATKLDAQAAVMATALTSVQAQMTRARGLWKGHGLEIFESDWNRQLRPALVTAHEQVSTMAKLLRSEAAAQVVTSNDLSGAGGGTGALPIGGSGGAGGSAGGTSSNPTGAGGPDGPGGDKGPDHEDYHWDDYTGWTLAGLGSPAVVAELNALRKFLPDAVSLGFGKVGNVLDQASAARDLQALVNAGKLTPEAATARLAQLAKDGETALGPLSKDVTAGLKSAGSEGGLGASDLAENAGKGFAGLAVLGDALTLWKPGKGGNGNRVAAGINLVATAAPFAADAGLLGANAAVDWIPVAGQVFAVGSAAYLAYEQIPGVKNFVNNTVSDVGDFGKTVGTDIGHAGAAVGKDIGHAGAAVGKSVGHAASSAWNDTFGSL